MLDKWKNALDTWHKRIAAGESDIEGLLAEVQLQLLLDKVRVYQLRRNVGKKTQEHLQPDLDGLLELWGNRILVIQQIDAAQAEYDKLGAWEALPPARKLITSSPDADQVGRKIKQILEGESVQLPATITPRAQRKFASPAAVISRVTPEVYWHAVEEAYNELNVIVTRIIQVQDRWLVPLGDANTNFTTLQKLAAELGVDEPALTNAAQRIQSLRAKVNDDPLSFYNDDGSLIDMPDSDNIVSLLDASLKKLQTLKAQKEKLAENITAGKLRLQQLLALRVSLQESWRRVRERICKPDAVAPDDDSAVNRLSTRFEGIEGAALNGNWQSAVKALLLWEPQVDVYASYLQTAIEQNQALLDKRLELRSSLRALQAMATANMVSENPEVAGIALPVHSMLFTNPTDLSHSEQLIDELGQLLTRLSKTNKQKHKENKDAM